jgi:hypothetical protein
MIFAFSLGTEVGLMDYLSDRAARVVNNQAGLDSLID